MNKVVFFDTETTGLPVWDKPSDSEEQPHLAQLAAIAATDWDISAEVSAIHGITKEKSLTDSWCLQRKKREKSRRRFG